MENGRQRPIVNSVQWSGNIAPYAAVLPTSRMIRDIGSLRTPAHTCPVCGFRGLAQAPYAKLVPLPVPEHLSPPYSRHFGMPSYEVCDCCGFEFGNDDEPGTATPVTFSEYRKQWLADGAQWFQPLKRPLRWSPENQLREVGLPLA